jgi:nicotinate-nucleotide adenylyltransferase
LTNLRRQAWVCQACRAGKARLILRLGILGGTFDPIHIGHLRSAEEICESFNLEKVYLIPSASPPHKCEAKVTPFAHRLAMARLAVETVPLLDVLDIEGQRQGFSYSIQTIRDLYNAFVPAPDICFIVGVDAFLEIKTWKEYKSLFDYSNFIIIQRPGFQVENFDQIVSSAGIDFTRNNSDNILRVSSGKTLTLVSQTMLDISSTGIRDLISTGRSIRFLVPDVVRDYIIENGLYKKLTGKVGT